ncbi:hypothetical protein SJAV_01030 [Sulfurisphaera javensis]|uniref:Uncharacterized protein n=1 Tax=Sulfurisphaera javensis TaxID=2049879 RepID=A0AAT9GMP0_9CREN
MNPQQVYKYSIFSIVILFITFSLGLTRALIDNGDLKTNMSEEVLIMHLIFAVVTGGLALYLYILAYRTGLLFPKFIALSNLTSIVIAGLSGLGYLLTTNDDFTRVMLYGFEVSLALTSMLVGYLYCFMRVCSR